MTFRNRLTLIAATAVAITVVAGAGIAYVLARAAMIGQVDAALSARTIELRTQLPHTILEGALGRQVIVPSPSPVAAGVLARFVDARGRVYGTSGSPDLSLPVRPDAAEIAAGRTAPTFSTLELNGYRVRTLATRFAPGIALEVARPIVDVDRMLARLRWLLLAVAAAGVALAGALGYAVTRTAVGPLGTLTEAAEHVARTKDLSRRIEPGGADEIGRLAASFNEMLEALESSQRTQRQLVADASHELRTPLASLRTNLEVLARGDALPEEDRRALLRDLTTEMEELTVLVGDLVQLARGAEPQHVHEEARLDELVGRVVERARARYPGVRFETDLHPSVVRCVPAGVERAVANLLDNAGKFAGDAGPVEVRSEGTRVEVRDHGPGIAAEDAQRVFERFYRAPSARALPGSGLGLAIVRHVAEQHGGSVRYEAAPGGGARFELTLAPDGPAAP